MGSLLIYIFRNRRVLLLPFSFIAVVGMLASVVMLVSCDGHGVGLIAGVLAALILPNPGHDIPQ